MTQPSLSRDYSVARASLAEPVCDLTFVTTADDGGYAPESAAGSNGETGRTTPEPPLLSRATIAQALSRSLGQWG